MVEVTPVSLRACVPAKRAAGLRADLVPAAAMAPWRKVWTDLSARCLEDDIFLHPDFALPAIAHLPGQSGVQFLLVHRADAQGETELVGLLALAPPKRGLPFVRDSWWHENACLGGPMLDAACCAEALDAMLDWLAAHRPRLALVTLREIQTDGPTAALLRTCILRRRLPQQTRNARQRAAFDARSDTGRRAMAGLTAHRRKRLRQHVRQVEAIGRLTYEQATQADDVRRVAEEFLALEAVGWKGRASSAFLNHAGKTQFARAIVHGLSDGRIRLVSLRLDGRPIAISIILRAGSRAYFWKIAYDEAHAAQSPGVLLVFRFMQAQAEDPTIALTDSCAVANHRMIETLWPERIHFADVVFAPSPARAHAFRAILALANARRGARTLAASLVRKLRRTS
jgi:CelD/BcsL family acetyltransferase involved in cellulose biosynthesis